MKYQYKLIKENERSKQNELYKPVKTKIVNNPIQSSTVSVNNNDYIKTYNELKNENQPKNTTNQNNYDNILIGLKDLGIIKY